MRNAFLILGVVAFHACLGNTVSAAVVNVTFDRSNQFTDNGVMTEVLNNVSATNGPNQSLGYMVSGLTIDANGTMDDSINFEFLLAATGSTASGKPARGIGFSSGNLGVNTDDSPASDEPSLFDLEGESITFSLANASVTLGAGSSQTATIDFTGFTGFGLNAFFGTETYNLSGGTSADGTALTVAPASFSPNPTFTLAYDGSTGGNGFRVNAIAATFEANVSAVPEPTSGTFMALAFVGSCAVTRRRRK